MNGDFTVDEPFVDGDGNSLWIDDYGAEGIFLFVKSADGCEIRVDLPRSDTDLLSERLAA